ncbi:tripartite tricarboxylate transporter TctB family protein [Ammoniphilus sp. 3BR4]|uniref:tripartite tricarboxylate transporter TctB family protein n=1 Tax=Ammoniphilus sp. 3BR4 TaxID=3158265 RepID=UPI0034677C41
MNIKMINGEVGLALLLFLLSIAYGYSALSFPEGYGEVGPAFFPYLITIGLAGISLILMVKSIKSSPVKFTFSKPHFFLFLLLAGYCLLLPIAGFKAATIAFNVFVSRLYGFAGWVKPLIFSIIMTLLLYGLFAIILKVPLT